MVLFILLLRPNICFLLLSTSEKWINGFVPQHDDTNIMDFLKKESNDKMVKYICVCMTRPPSKGLVNKKIYRE